MFRKILTFGLLLSVSAIGAAAQSAEQDKVTRTFAFTIDGNGGYLGVQTVEITRDNTSKYGLNDVRGVAVEKVMDGSPAAAAGIRSGDVIVRINGEAITSTRKLTRVISEIAPDQQARVTIIRGGSEQEITATIGKRPMPQFEEGRFTMPLPDLPEMPQLERLRELFKNDGGGNVFTFPEGEADVFTLRPGTGRQIGVNVYPVTKQLGERYGVDGGVLINSVGENSAAAKAGLKAGDIIVEVDGKQVKNNLDLMRSVNEKKEGDVILTFVRDRTRQTVTVTPEPMKDGSFFFRTERSVDGPARTSRPGMTVFGNRNML
ncbi:MAG: PDZ domain-containing protein [Acidobacteriota bacterium]|nr:MAG: PDZ domain-containing protein [Acidobacteriota bacterium]